jgi:hypothetical protein
MSPSASRFLFGDGVSKTRRCAENDSDSANVSDADTTSAPLPTGARNAELFRRKSNFISNCTSTPAMEAGLSKSIWEIEDLLNLID